MRTVGLAVGRAELTWRSALVDAANVVDWDHTVGLVTDVSSEVSMESLEHHECGGACKGRLVAVMMKGEKL
jgi:hypothetical protein